MEKSSCRPLQRLIIVGYFAILHFFCGAAFRRFADLSMVDVTQRKASPIETVYFCVESGVSRDVQGEQAPCGLSYAG